MWWHGGAGLTERSERGTLYAVATHDFHEKAVNRKLKFTSTRFHEALILMGLDLNVIV
jgi:hypothetical protein